MLNNRSLINAKKAKNNEFYTQLSDVEKELKHYEDFFNGKKILCNCNDDKWSAFFKYFSMNFEHLGLKQLVCVSYNENGHGKKYTYNSNMEFNETELNGNGDFSSDECVELLKDCDVVVTNPPFSLFCDFVALLQQYEKKFLIIGNSNAITYKEIFPLIKDNKMWLGVNNGSKKYEIPTIDNTKKYEEVDGKYYQSLGNTCWFTNIPHDKRNQPLDLYEKYNAEEYPKYDNYDAINVNKVTDIPIDYDGVIGVPISFLDKYCPTQFEIVGIMTGAKGNGLTNGNDGRAKFYVNNKGVYARILIKKIS